MIIVVAMVFVVMVQYGVGALMSLVTVDVGVGDGIGREAFRILMKGVMVTECGPFLCRLLL